MKLIIAQIFTFYILRETSSLDVSHYHHGLDHSTEHKKPIIPILKYNTEQSHKGWKYSYESGNGIHAEETGYIKNQGDEKHEIVVQQGSVTYHDEHGHPITLHYIADENGFRPQGEHLPTPPPIPEDIQKGLEEQDDGGQIQITEEQDEYEGKEAQEEQSQSYAETQVHSKLQAYEPEPSYGYRQVYRKGQTYGQGQSYGEGQSHGQGQDYEQGQNYGQGSSYGQGQYKRRFIINS